MDNVCPHTLESQRLDLLDRQEFVDRLLTIAGALSNSKKNSCYAVNGDWGVGKSFVLDMFEEQAKDIGVEGETLSRYLLFRYNCWEYDYYEEPLVAIVASMLDQINEKIDLIPADTKTRIVAALKAVGKGLVKKAVQLIEEKTGVEIEDVLELVKDGTDTAREEVKESHKYDQFFDFKKNLKMLRETITSLSQEQTLIFMVDELDRCLPEYTIKVLERLHHLFDGIPNVQVILSIDIGQLEHVVQQIYGEKTDAKKYLRKFIQFELKLDEGSIKENVYELFEKRFGEYTQLFEIKKPTTSDFDVGIFKTYVFDGIDMRSRISIIDRCKLVHSLLNPDEKTDSSYYCLEILLVILNDLKIDIEYAKRSFSISAVFLPERLWTEKDRKVVPDGLLCLSERYKVNSVNNRSVYPVFSLSGSERRGLINVDCLLGALLHAYREILGINDDLVIDSLNTSGEFVEFAKKYWGILQIIS